MFPRAALLAVTVAACSHGSANLAGHWHGVRSEGVRSDVLDSTNAYAVRLRMDVKGDSITLTSGGDARTDHYSVVQEDKTHTVIVTTTDGDKDPQTFTVIDPKTIKWSVAPNQSIVFVKD